MPQSVGLSKRMEGTRQLRGLAGEGVGENDLLVPPSHAREFVERMRHGSRHALYGELPGGQHDFDLYESIRSNAVSIAIERFIMNSEELPKPRGPAQPHHG